MSNQCPTTDSGSGVVNWGQFVDTLTSNEVRVRFGILFKLCQEELTYTYTWNLLLYEIPIYLPTCKANLVLSKYSLKKQNLNCLAMDHQQELASISF